MEDTEKTMEVQPQEQVEVECRACLQKFEYDAGLVDIFQPWDPPWDGMGDSIAQDMAQITNIDITPTDEFSKLICQFCYQKLLDACSFIVNVRINDRLLRQRVESLHDQETIWPKPIQVDRNINSDVFNNPMDVPIKQEVLSDDESYANGGDESFKEGIDGQDGADTYSNLEIKIEPEEIMQAPPIQITVNGTITQDQFEQNSIVMNGDHKPPEIEPETEPEPTPEPEKVEIKVEPKSEDEEVEVPPDLSLECMLCTKSFNSVTGLKAHVIAQHSYKSVKRKLDGQPSPEKKRAKHVCVTCRRCTVHQAGCNMPRRRNPIAEGKSYKKYAKHVIEKAVKEYKSGRGTLSAIADKYDINKSVLHRHSHRIMKSHGGQKVLSEEIESEIVEYINLCVQWGYQFESYDLRVLVKKYLDNLGIQEKRFKGNMPGTDFAKNFLKRHGDEISQTIAMYSRMRSKVAESPRILKDYFERLEHSISGIPASNIINYEEYNLEADVARKKIVTKRDTKYPDRMANHPNATMTVLMACTAAGEILTPYLVFKEENIKKKWRKFGPVRARYNSTPSGWLDVNIFEDWVSSIVIPYLEDKPGNKCLIGDNLISHITINTIKMCQENNIHFVFLPPNSTQIIKPLDVAFFKPMKKAWRDIILQWVEDDRTNHLLVRKNCFPKLLSKLLDRLNENRIENIVSAFEKTGIHPYNPKKVLSRLPHSDRDEIENKEE